MTEHPRIPLAGVIGHPVAHSRSPALHGFWLKRAGIAGHYVPLDVASADLKDVLQLLPRMGFVGANVTIPHKEAVLAFAQTITDRAALIGAANTLVFRKNGSIIADNTDGLGFIANLVQNAPGWKAAAGPAAVLGAGGAARAVVCALLDAGAPEIRIANRTRLRAQALRTDFGARVKVFEWTAAPQMIEGCATLVNTTALGMVGKAELPEPILQALHKIQRRPLVTDLVYAPLMTQLLIVAEDCGCPVVDGLGMLLHQAAPGFERWFGARPSVDQASRDAVLSA